MRNFVKDEFCNVGGFSNVVGPIRSKLRACIRAQTGDCVRMRALRNWPLGGAQDATNKNCVIAFGSVLMIQPGNWVTSRVKRYHKEG